LLSHLPQPSITINVDSGTQTQAAAGYPLLTPANATSVTKTGAGTVVFDAANTYTGPTSIQQGVLAITGTNAIAGSSLVNLSSGGSFDVSGLSGGYTVPSGQTIAGSGTVLGSVTFGAGSTLSPGMFDAASGASMLAADMQAGSLQALVVPEPATLGLVGAGVGFLGLGALRRKRA
jgi:autotransporter-associated beta strand protein